MTIATEKKLRDFQFWSGAETNAAKLTPEELDQLEDEFEELACDRANPWTETEINDLLWFDFEAVCEWIGLDAEEVLARE